MFSIKLANDLPTTHIQFLFQLPSSISVHQQTTPSFLAFHNSFSICSISVLFFPHSSQLHFSILVFTILYSFYQSFFIFIGKPSSPIFFTHVYHLILFFSTISLIHSTFTADLISEFLSLPLLVLPFTALMNFISPA